METNKIYLGNALDVLRTMPNDSIDCCVTSPPYYALRDYGTVSQIGLEKTPTKYVEKLTEVFMGSGTTGLVANKLGRRYIGIELNPEYKEMAEKRIMEESSHVKIDFRKQEENNETIQLTLF